MAKPYMCGDEIAVHVPDGGCDCNYTIQLVESEDYAFAYNLLLDGEQVGDTITIPFDKVVIEGEIVVEGDNVFLDLTIDNQQEHVFVPFDYFSATYYNKEEVDDLIQAVSEDGYIVVSSLPAEGDMRYIYLLDNGDNTYTQYVWDVASSDWIDLGNTGIDLDNYYTKAQIDNLFNAKMLEIYPVGAIYMSASSTNPSNLFGGTWVQIKDTFLLAAGDTYTADDGTHTTATGGEATHKLTVSEMPSHTHTQNPHRHGLAHKMSSGTGSQYAYTQTANRTQFDPVTDYTTAVNQNTGGNGAHNNMPPYLPIYVWKRTV